MTTPTPSFPGSPSHLRHPERDPDLLLLAHQALPPLPAALTRLHLLGCADCRRRLAELQAVSQALAAAVRGPGMPRWSPSGFASPSLALAAGALLAAAVLLGLALVALTVRGHREAPAAPRAAGPCRPDLPNDRCR